MTFIFSKKTTNHISGLVTQLRHLRYIFDFISMLCFLCNKVFSRQPCCMAGATDSFSYGKKLSFLCKIFPLFLPCNMAAVQNLYNHNHLDQVRHFILKKGFQETINISLNLQGRKAYISEGNHCLWVALKEGIPFIQCRVIPHWLQPDGWLVQKPWYWCCQF